jgi:hypothetical protein
MDEFNAPEYRWPLDVRWSYSARTLPTITIYERRWRQLSFDFGDWRG